MKKLILLIVLLVLAVFQMSAKASVTYTFTHIWEEGDSPSQIANGNIGENQFFVDVSKPFVGSEQTLFTFRNVGPNECFIDGVYFYDGALFKIASLIDVDETYGGLIGDPNVDFSEDATPGHLPGLDLGEYKLMTGFELEDVNDADADSGAINGVHPGEYLGVLFDLYEGQTFNDVLAGLNEGSTLIGIKAQGFPYGGSEDSEAFINNGIIPAPGAVLLGGIGVCLVGWLRRRRML